MSTPKALQPSYITYVPGAGRLLDPGFGVSKHKSCLSPTCSCFFQVSAPDPLATTALPIPPIPKQYTDESNSLEIMSDDVDLHCILPNLSLGHEERQHIFDQRLRRLVLFLLYFPFIIINPLLAV